MASATIMTRSRSSVCHSLYFIFRRSLDDLADIGLGIAFVPDFCVTQKLHDLFPIRLASTLPSRQLALVHKEQMPVSNAARQFMDYF